MRSIFTILLFYFMLTPLAGQQIKIGLFNDHLCEAFTYHCTHGSYEVSADGVVIDTLYAGELLYITMVDDKVRLNSGTFVIGDFSEVFFRDKTLKGRFRIKMVMPSISPRNYDGDLLVRLRQRSLQLINETSFDTYLAGVIETEAGPNAEPEFYKAQAVLCRTFAVKNWNMYINQGFNLCDDVGCQAYKGINEINTGILKAVLATYKMVVTNPYSVLIQAAYHSNSGGETQEGSKLWPGEHPYLMPIIDPFSEDQRNYRWTETLDKNIWFAYLNALGVNTKVKDSTSLLIQQKHRRVHYSINNDTVNIPSIRQDFGFKSAFFSMEMLKDSIHIEGRGYGHGVGLSQEGAMEMARQGYSYEDILRFYYFDIRIKNLDDLPLSQVPEEFR